MLDLVGVKVFYKIDVASSIARLKSTNAFVVSSPSSRCKSLQNCSLFGRSLKAVKKILLTNPLLCGSSTSRYASVTALFGDISFVTKLWTKITKYFNDSVPQNSPVSTSFYLFDLIFVIFDFKSEYTGYNSLTFRNLVSDN